jgi:ribosomal protein S18 acetylase RimI-like enzyme
MPIVPYQPAHLPSLYQGYRQLVAAIPHCRFIPSQAYVGQALAQAEQAGTRLLVAECRNEVCGVASFRPAAPAHDGVHEMEITSLFAPEEATTAALLEACLAQAEGARRLVAFPPEHLHCPLPSYNAGWDELSDKLPWVARALARHGFAPVHRELHLECAAPHFPYSPAEMPPAPDGITMVEGSEGGYMAVRAMAGDQEAGICLFTLLSAHSDHPEAHEWGYVDWLHVAESQRRRGLGRYLMTWALGRLRERGCQGCWLTPGANNWPAQPLYLGLGFEIRDTSSSWVKLLSAG